MTTEIARREPNATLPEKMEWARALASSNLLPKQYQNNPGNLLFAVEYADALGVSRINAITSIHVIEGKPSASADLIASLVRRAGHKLRVSGDDTYALAQLIRADDPEFTYEARWDVNKARAAGLLGKSVWKSYPGAMLRSRAITEVARMGASDALFGVIYTPEELGAEVDDEGDVVHNVTTARHQSSGADRMRQMLDAPAPEPEAAREETPAAEIAGITSAQVKKLATAMGKAGITDRKAALDYVAQVVGRQVGSRNELTKDEASRVIDALERQAAEAEQAPANDEPVDAEIVEEEGDPETAWSDVLDIADDLGMNEKQVRNDFEQRYAMDPGSASAGELRAYLEVLRTEGRAA